MMPARNDDPPIRRQRNLAPQVPIDAGAVGALTLLFGWLGVWRLRGRR